MPKLSPLVIIPCGGAKRTEDCPAGEMYIGGYHRACQAYALSLAPLEEVLILSAKHGLLRLGDIISPYELRMGQPGSVMARIVKAQAQRLRVADWSGDVIALGGKRYIAVCKVIWPDCLTPLEGVGGIGKQMAWMKAHKKSPGSFRGKI